MGPFYETIAIFIPTLIACAVFGVWFIPKFDAFAGRLSDWMEDRKDRRAGR